MIRKKGSKTWYIILLVICIMFLLYGAGNGKNKMGLLAVILSIILMLLSDEEDSFNFLVAMIPFQDCWIISGVSLRGIMCLFPMIKLLLKRRIKTTGLTLFSIFTLVSVELINDLINSTLPSFINTICPVLYLGIFAITVGNNTKSWNIKKMIIVFITSTTLACTANLIVGGGISAYFNDISWYRFGQESNISLLPGAMEIPVFNTICIFTILALFAYDRIESTIEKIVFMGLLMIHVLFGLLTVSRVFVIGIGTIVLLFFIWMITNNKIGRVSILVLILIVVGMVLYIRERDLIVLLVSKLFGRLSSETSFSDNGRTYIWKDCISYLLEHPKAFLIGEGIEHYPVLGRNLGYGFSAMAHNYYLDILMAVGFVGAICLVILYRTLVYKDRKRNILSFGILFSLAFVYLVSGTLNYTRNYIYIMMGIIFMNNFKEQIENKQ